MDRLKWMRQCIRQYKDADLLKGDLNAGLTVGVMLIPQGMAYAMIAGLPAIYGLYASTIPLIIYALLGSSSQLAVGPVAMTSLLTASSISVLADAGTDQYIAMAMLLGGMVGIIRLLSGILRLGYLIEYIPQAVINGYTSAAALIIAFSQVKHLLGIDIDGSEYIIAVIADLIRHWSEINLAALSIGLLGVIVILLLRYSKPKIPAALIVVGIATFATYILEWEAMVHIVGAVPSGLPSLSFPIFSNELIVSLLPSAIIITLISFMESIAIAKKMEDKHKDHKVLPNQELIALGFANIIGALFQSYPITGGFSRTAVNDQAGAKSKMAGLFSAVVIVITLLYLTPLFYYLPTAILASIIIVAVVQLIDIHEPVKLWHSDKRSFSMLIITFLSTITLGIMIGVVVGIMFALIVVLAGKLLKSNRGYS